MRSFTYDIGKIYKQSREEQQMWEKGLLTKNNDKGIKKK